MEGFGGFTGRNQCGGEPKFRVMGMGGGGKGGTRHPGPRVNLVPLGSRVYLESMNVKQVSVTGLCECGTVNSFEELPSSSGGCVFFSFFP